jgi:hypothetical protein
LQLSIARTGRKSRWTHQIFGCRPATAAGILRTMKPLDDTPDTRDRIRRCGTVDTEFFEWLDKLSEPMDLDDAADPAVENLPRSN